MIVESSFWRRFLCLVGLHHYIPTRKYTLDWKLTDPFWKRMGTPPFPENKAVSCLSCMFCGKDKKEKVIEK